MTEKEQELNKIKNNTQRNVLIDIAKGILIVLMVIGHSGIPQWLESMVYTFHMPCFFIISGFLFSEKYLSSPKKFIFRRIRSLWWPFVVWTWIFILLHNIFYAWGLYEQQYNYPQMFKNIGAAAVMMHVEQLTGGFWFIISLFIATLITFAYYKLFGTSSQSLLTGVLIFVAIAEILEIFNYRFYYFNKVNMLVCAYFMIGTWLRNIIIKRRKYDRYLIFFAVILLALSAFQKKTEILNVDKILLIPYFIESVLISYAFLLLVENFKGRTWHRYLCYLGEKTLDILIFHFLAFKLVSLLKISLFGLNVNKLKDFPVIKDENEFFWIVYVVLGLILCIFFSKGKDYISKYLKKQSRVSII